MTTVLDILWGVGQKLPGVWFTGLADGGSTTTIVDAEIGGSDDVYIGGTALVKVTTDGLAPQGESRIISDYDAKGAGAGDGLVTVQSAFSAAVGAGDRYGLIKKRYRRELILQMMNDALTNIRLQENDDSSLDTASNTKLYTLPAGVVDDNLLQVWIAERTSAPYNWERSYDWRVVQDGGTHSLLFWNYPIYTRDIRLVYNTYHAEVYDDDDTIDARIHPEMLVAMTLRRVIEWRYSRFPVPPQREQIALNAALRREADQMRWMPKLPQATPKFPPFDAYSPSIRMPVPEDS